MQIAKDLLAMAWNTLVVGKEKAIVAALVAAVGTFVARHGWTLDASQQAFLQAILLGVVAHIAVFFTTNRK